MATIDIRKDSNEMVDKIRFADDLVINIDTYRDIWVGSELVGAGVNMRPEEVPNLIKALQKYMELYGEQ